jgi:hypothetical protein
LKNLHLTDILQRGLGRDPPQRFVRLKAPYFVLDDLCVRNRGAQPRGGALKGVFFSVVAWAHSTPFGASRRRSYMNLSTFNSVRLTPRFDCADFSVAWASGSFRDDIMIETPSIA